jgi:hypothetical protein
MIMARRTKETSANAGNVTVLGTDHYSMLNDEWKVTGNKVFESVLSQRQPEQFIIFSDSIKNGSISADITPLAAREARGEHDMSLEAAIVFRYSGPDSYYYVGLSAFRTKFFVARVLGGPFYQLLNWVGQRAAVSVNKTYRLKVEFAGSQITLYENDVRQIQVTDEMYKTGQWGLRTYASSARFENIRVTRAQPTCFVVMPFASELSYVYQLIKQSVEKYGLRCERSDEIFVSKPVVEDLKDKIAEADLVIVDFTGKNPNVYYEAGLADAWKKDWIILAQSSEDMTFDVRHIRSIRYSNMMGADIQLRQHLEQSLEALGYRKQDLDKTHATPTGLGQAKGKNVPRKSKE